MTRKKKIYGHTLKRQVMRSKKPIKYSPAPHSGGEWGSRAGGVLHSSKRSQVTIFKPRIKKTKRGYEARFTA